MPAAAVTPGPVAYIKVVAVKKLVVGYLARVPGPPPFGLVMRRRCLSHPSGNHFSSFGRVEWDLDLLL